MPSKRAEHGLSELRKSEENRAFRGYSLTHNISRRLSHNLVAHFCAAGFYFSLIFTQAALVTQNREPNVDAYADGESSVSCANTWNTYGCAQSVETFGRTNGGYAQSWCDHVHDNDLLKLGNPRRATDGRTLLTFRRTEVS